jgi:hypothetical protein
MSRRTATMRYPQFMLIPLAQSDMQSLYGGISDFRMLEIFRYASEKPTKSR